MAKVNITIDDKLLEKIDRYIDDNFMSRSGFFAFSANQILLQSEIMLAVNKLTLAFQKIAESGDVSDETKKELEDYLRVANLFLQKK